MFLKTHGLFIALVINRIKLQMEVRHMKGEVVAILRGFSYEQVRSVCTALTKSEKIKNVEITMNTPNALDIISKIVDEFQGQLNIGAGTVITFDDLKQVIEKGVKFVLSPSGYTKEMIEYCHKRDVVAIPAALTPTEILTQFENGADIVKVFPANEFTKGYAKKVCEPLGNYPLMAVGGVNTKTVKEYLDGGYQYVGSCWGLFKKEDVLNQNEDGMLKSIKEFETNM